MATLTLTLSTPATPRAARDQRARAAPSICDLRRIAELDVEGDVAALDAQVAQLLGGDEIAAGLGVDDGLQGLEQIGFVDGHEGVRPRGRPVPRQSSAAVRSPSSAVSSPRTIGLTRWPSKPASFERWRSSSWPQPVMAMIGIVRAQGSARRRRQTS